jgi:deazaflavin-dependent oxidoreductase (nitroreductase family)
MPLLLLHHVGARSGVERITPLVYWRVTDESVAVLASNRGAARHPHWYFNLLAHPVATVELGAETWKVRARDADLAERDVLLKRIVTGSGSVAAALGRTTREIPVVILERLGAGA